MKLRKFLCMIIVFVITLPMVLPAYGATPYANYFLSDDGWNLPTPAAYKAVKVIDFKTKEEGKLTAPSDLFIAKNGNIYIVDSGNNRIVVLNSKHEFLFDVKGNPDDPEDPANLNNPKGVYVDSNGTILVADYGNKRLVEFTAKGSFRYAYLTPTSDILPADFNYQPQKVIKDQRGYIFVTSVGEYHGIILLGADGEFRNYFGANKVVLSLGDAIARLLWSREDRKGSIVNLPYTFNNIYGSEDQYIYATTTGTSAQLRKINPQGTDVLYNDKNFTDQSLIWGPDSTQNFVDVAVDKDNNMFLIDSTFGRIYEYDEWGRNLFVFGTLGTGYGQYSTPVSIEIDVQGRVYVLDSRTGVITVFKTTEFADTVHSANKYYSNGQYKESYTEWNKVLSQDSYYRLALQAMGSVHMRKEEYKKAMDLFYEAEDPLLYSTAYEEQRTLFIKDYFSIIASVIIFLLLLLVVLKTIKSKRLKKYGPKPEKKNWFTPIKHFFKRMTYVARHPIDGFEEIRYEGKGYFGDMFAIMFLQVITTVLSKLLTSFIYRGGTSLDMYNWGYIILLSIIPWAVICVVNYGVTTIMYGEGRFRDVIIGGAYCHVPFILTSVPFAIATQVLTQSEMSLFNLANTLIAIWAGLLVFFCIKGVHGFHPIKAVVVTILTAVGVSAVSALFMIVYGLAVQMFDFIAQVVKELSYLV